MNITIKHYPNTFSERDLSPEFFMIIPGKAPGARIYFTGQGTNLVIFALL